MLDMFLLILATTCDSFFMSIAYGVEGIRISWKAILIIAFCGSMFLGISMMLAGVITCLLSSAIAKRISFVILFGLGLIHIFRSQVKYVIRRYKEKPLVIRFSNVSFVVDIMLDEKAADMDRSKELNSKEAMYLGIALSLDSLASGIAYGIGYAHVGLLLILSFSVGVTMIIGGRCIGSHISRYAQRDVSWISGILLMVLALLRLK